MLIPDANSIYAHNMKNMFGGNPQKTQRSVERTIIFCWAGVA